MLDYQNILSNNQTVAFATSTVVSTNTFDTRLVSQVGTDDMGNSVIADIGRSGLFVEVVITDAVLSAGAATLQVDLITSAAANLGSPTIISSTIAVPKASLVAGYKFRLALPAGLAQRYVGVQYTVGTATTTAGTVTAWIGDEASTAYAI